MKLLLKQNPWILLSFIQSIAGLHLVHLYEKQSKEFKKLHSVTTYLVDVMEKNDVPLTQFDIIALHDLGVGVTVVEES